MAASLSATLSPSLCPSTCLTIWLCFLTTNPYLSYLPGVSLPGGHTHDYPHSIQLIEEQLHDSREREEFLDKEIKRQSSLVQKRAKETETFRKEAEVELRLPSFREFTSQPKHTYLLIYS